MATYKQLFTFKKSGGLTAACKRELIATMQRVRSGYYKNIAAAMPAERSGNYSSDAVESARQTKHTIPLSESIARDAYFDCKKENPRKQNITHGEAGYGSYTREDCFEYRGNYRGYHGSNYVPVVKSVGHIDKTGKILGYVVDVGGKEKRGHVKAGRGYTWQVGILGIALVKTSNNAEYHPSTDDVFSGFAAMRSKLLRNDRIRKQHARERREEAAKQKNSRCELLTDLADSEARVSIVHSNNAGNCETGSMIFCRKLGISPRESYQVCDVVRKAASCKDLSYFELRRFRAACKVAIRSCNHASA